MKHFSRHKLYATMALNDEDDELEALRLAALQTIKPRRNQFPHSGRFHRIDNNPNLIAIVPLIDKACPAPPAVPTSKQAAPNLFPNITVIKTEDSPVGRCERPLIKPLFNSSTSAPPIKIVPSDNVTVVSLEKPSSTESVLTQVQVCKGNKEDGKEDDTPDTTFEEKLDYEEEEEESEEDHDFVSLDDEDLSLEKLMDQMEQEFSQCNGKSKKSKSQKKSKKKSGVKETSNLSKKSPIMNEPKTKISVAEMPSSVGVSSCGMKNKPKSILPGCDVKSQPKSTVVSRIGVKADETVPVEVKPDEPPVVEPIVKSKVPEKEVKRYSPPAEVKVKSFERSRSRSPVGRVLSRSPVRRRSPRWSPKRRRSPSPKYKRESPRRYRRSDSTGRSPTRKYRVSPGRSPSPRRRRGHSPDRMSPIRTTSPRRNSTYRSLSPRDKRKSPYRTLSPDRRKSPFSGASPRKKSPYRGTSPIKRKSPYRTQSPLRKKSPYRGVTPPKRKSPFRAASPPRRKSPYRGASPSIKFRAGSRSPVRKKSPYRSGSPVKRKSPFRATSPLKRKSPYRMTSPIRHRSASPPHRRKSPYRVSPSRRKSPTSECHSQSPTKYSPRRKSPPGRNSPVRKKQSPSYRSPRSKKASPVRYESPIRKRQASPDCRRSDSPIRRASPKRQSPPRKHLSPSIRPASPRRRYSPSRSPTRRHRRSTSPLPSKTVSSESSNSSRSKVGTCKKPSERLKEEANVRPSRNPKRRSREPRDKTGKEKPDPVLEARRRKFQSNSLVGSGASLNKKIRLKPLSDKEAPKPSVKSPVKGPSRSTLNRPVSKIEKKSIETEGHGVSVSRGVRTVAVGRRKLTGADVASTQNEKGVDTHEGLAVATEVIVPDKKVEPVPVTKCDFSTQVTLEEDSQLLQGKMVKPAKKERLARKLLKRKSSESEKDEPFARRKKISVNIRPTALQVLEEKSRRRSERQQMLKREEDETATEVRGSTIGERWKQRSDRPVDLASPSLLETHNKGPDLRAELSRRRAQRLKGIGSMGPTRLVQSALEGVVKKKDEEKWKLDPECSMIKKKSKMKAVDVGTAPSSKIRRVQILHVEHPTLSISDSDGSDVSAESSDDCESVPTKGRSILARNQV